MDAHIRYVYPKDGEWAIRSPDGHRISHLCDSKTDAVERAKRIVGNLGGGYVLIQDCPVTQCIAVQPRYS